jgi:Uma2 family endonuclease
LTARPDDGIVVVKVGEDGTAMTVDEYFREPESLRPMELIYGTVHEPPAPRYGHQSVVTRITSELARYVRKHSLGAVCVSPIDVVLDSEAALVLQPDVIFVSIERTHIISDRVWGAPDLVVEVLSRRTAARDRTQKLAWYRQYGVRECWLVDPAHKQVEVVTWDGANSAVRAFGGDAPLQSTVVGTLDVSVDEFFS